MAARPPSTARPCLHATNSLFLLHLALLEGEGGAHALLLEQFGQQDGHQGQRVDLGHRRRGDDLQRVGQGVKRSISVQMTAATISAPLRPQHVVRWPAAQRGWSGSAAQGGTWGSCPVQCRTPSSAPQQA